MAMQDIHKGFQDVNQVSDTEAFFSFLDAADALETTQAYRQRMLELHPPKPGQHILDIGCGVGHSALRLARMVGETGSVVGIDKSEALVAEAQRRAARASARPVYRLGDARQLDLASQSFDVCRTERVLMYVDHPEQVLDEMIRVLRPGGALALFEFDYDGIVVDAPDQALTRQLVRLVASSVPSPWIGRQLPRLLRERGVHGLTIVPHMILTPLAMFRRVTGGTIDEAVRSGELGAQEVEAWWQALAQADRAGHFFSGFAGFLVCGQSSERRLM
jgi:ubiquinone/menaquinone biosynthesis C-methylase UbiE